MPRRLNVSFCTDRWTVVHYTVGPSRCGVWRTQSQTLPRVHNERTRGRGPKLQMRSTPLETENFLRKRWSTGCPHLLPDYSQHSAGWCPNLGGRPAWSREQKMRPPQHLHLDGFSVHSGQNKVPSPLAEFTRWVLTSYRLKTTVVMTWKNNIAIFLTLTNQAVMVTMFLVW